MDLIFHILSGCLPSFWWSWKSKRGPRQVRCTGLRFNFVVFSLCLFICLGGGGGGSQCQRKSSTIFVFLFLFLTVPAKIIDHLSTGDLVVRENEKVTLVCNVTGVPMPEVTWYRHVNYQKGVEKQSEFCPSTDRKQSVMCFFLFCVLFVHPPVNWSSKLPFCCFHGSPCCLSPPFHPALSFNRTLRQILSQRLRYLCIYLSCIRV